MIKITRGVIFRDAIRPYKIFIDDIYCGDIMRGETKEFTADNGTHTVCAKIDWCSSNVLCVNVDDSVVNLEVGSSLEGWRFLLMSLYMSIWKHKYLWLREKETTDKSQEGGLEYTGAEK